jgi:hypothetical protein
MKKIGILFALFIAIITGCKKDEAPLPTVSISADKTVVKLFDEITFNVEGNAELFYIKMNDGGEKNLIAPASFTYQYKKDALKDSTFYVVAVGTSVGDFGNVVIHAKDSVQITIQP